MSALEIDRDSLALLYPANTIKEVRMKKLLVSFAVVMSITAFSQDASACVLNWFYCEVGGMWSGADFREDMCMQDGTIEFSCINGDTGEVYYTGSCYPL